VFHDICAHDGRSAVLAPFRESMLRSFNRLSRDDPMQGKPPTSGDNLGAAN